MMGRPVRSLPRVGRWTRRGGALMLSLLLLAACEDKTTATAETSEEKDAGANAALVDKNIQNAVKSVAEAPNAAAADGPPPSGVFAVGGADRAHAPNAPPNIVMVARGSEPRVKLRPSIAGKQQLRLTVMKNYAQQIILSIDYQLSAVISRGGEDNTGPPTLVLTIDKADPSAPQQGIPAMPADVAKKIQELKGTTLSMSMSPGGALGVETIALPKDATKGSETLTNMALGALAEMVSLAMPSWPQEAVGVGAYWVADDRTLVSGVPVVRYRVTRIEKIEGDNITYSTDLRQYAADASSLPTGVPVGLTLAGFQSQGKAAASRTVGALWPSAVELHSPIVMQLISPQQPQRAAPLQVDTKAQLISAVADAKKAADPQKAAKP